MKRYAVSLKICHIENEENAIELADIIKDKLRDINEDIYICIGTYEQVKKKTSDYNTFNKLTTVLDSFVMNR